MNHMSSIDWHYRCNFMDAIKTATPTMADSMKIRKELVQLHMAALSIKVNIISQRMPVMPKAARPIHIQRCMFSS